MKKICFDLRALQIGHQNRGIGMYIKSVLEHLPADSENTYLFYIFDKSNPILDLDIDLKVDYELVSTPTIKTSLQSPKDLPGLIKLISHRFKNLRKHKPNVFVQFDFVLGLPRWKKVRKIVIGYDLIPLIMKSEYLPSFTFAMKQTRTLVHRGPVRIIRSVAYRLKNRSFGIKATPAIGTGIRSAVRSIYYRYRYSLHCKSFRHADHIVSISKATSKDFTRLLGIAKEKITTITPAPVFSENSSDKSIVDQIPSPYVFYIGGTDSRKRIQDIIYAFNIVRGRGADLKLVLAGNEFTKLNKVPDVAGRKAITSSPYRDDIYLVGFVSDAQKMSLYEHAHAFIFCTVYEGFGLPIIEAMSASCPVISYNNSSIPEAAGQAAILVDTGDYPAIATGILDLYDPKYRESAKKSGLLQSRKFNWGSYVTKFKKTILADE